VLLFHYLEYPACKTVQTVLHKFSTLDIFWYPARGTN